MCHQTLVSYAFCGCKPSWFIPYCNGTPLTKGSVDRLHLDDDALPVQACLLARIFKADRDDPQAAIRSGCDDFFWKHVEISAVPCYKCFHQLESTRTTLRTQDLVQTSNWCDTEVHIWADQDRRIKDGLSQKFIPRLLTPKKKGDKNGSYRIRLPFSWELCRDSVLPDSLNDETVMRQHKVMTAVKVEGLSTTNGKVSAETTLFEQLPEVEKNRRNNLIHESLARVNLVANHSSDQVTVRHGRIRPASPDGQEDLVPATSHHPNIKLSAATAAMPRKLKPGALDLGPPGTYSYTSLRYPPGHREDVPIQEYATIPFYVPKQAIEDACYKYGQYLLETTKYHNFAAGWFNSPGAIGIEPRQLHPEHIRARRRRNDEQTKHCTRGDRKISKAGPVTTHQQGLPQQRSTISLDRYRMTDCRMRLGAAFLSARRQAMQSTQMDAQGRSNAGHSKPPQEQPQESDRRDSLNALAIRAEEKVETLDLRTLGRCLRPDAPAFVPGEETPQ